MPCRHAGELWGDRIAPQFFRKGGLRQAPSRWDDPFESMRCSQARSANEADLELHSTTVSSICFGGKKGVVARKVRRERPELYYRGGEVVFSLSQRLGPRQGI